MRVVVSGPIGKNGGIQQFSAAGTLPGIERTDKVIKLLSEHTAFATWTMHRIPPVTVINQDIGGTTYYMPITQVSYAGGKIKYIQSVFTVG